MPAIAAVFEKGVFRPLKPVVLPDQYPSEVVFDDPPAKEEPLPVAAVPKDRPPAVYPEEYPDLGEDTYEYVAPPKVTRTVMVTFVDGGVRPAPQVSDEE